jgi:hypothetical protein
LPPTKKQLFKLILTELISIGTGLTMDLILACLMLAIAWSALIQNIPLGSSLPMDIPNYTEESRRGYYVDQDCSAASATCAIPGDAFKRQGAINYGDTFGTNMDAGYRISGEILPTFFMVTYGVPVYPHELWRTHRY